MNRSLFYICLAFFLSAGTLVSLSIVAERAAPGQMVDFEMVYAASRTVIEHHNPYKESDFLSTYESEKKEFRSGITPSRAFLNGASRCVYLPTALLLVTPVAMLPWQQAHVIWMAVSATSLVVAACLMFSLAQVHSKVVALFLTCFLLANSEVLIAGGNTAGLAVGCCVISVWCFIRERFVIAGVICLGISLAIKPHDSGLIWVYFLLAQPKFRSRAFQAFLLTALLGFSASFWVSKVAPHWTTEENSNLEALSALGGINNPGPLTTSGHDPHTIIDLQTVFSLISESPLIYNSITYALSGLLLLIWSFFTLRSFQSQGQINLALASITAISMLPVYHRLYDAKLLLLTVPACAMLWAEGKLIGWLALAINSAAIVLTGDFPTLIMGVLTRDFGNHAHSESGLVKTILLHRPFPIILLLVGIFYLAIYAYRGIKGQQWPEARGLQFDGLFRRQNQKSHPAVLIKCPAGFLKPEPRKFAFSRKANSPT